MKKVLAFILAAGMLLCFAACGGENVETTPNTDETTASSGDNTTGSSESTETTNTPPVVVEASKEFDPDNIVFSFGEVSDVHISNSSSDTSAMKFESALRQLQAEALKSDSKGLAAVLSAGDMIDGGGYGGKYNQMGNVKKVYEKVFSPKDVPMIFAPGNHDVEWTLSSVFQVDTLKSYLGDDYYLTDVDNKAFEDEGNRHCVVGGFHVISLVPVTKDPVTYTQATKDWLDATLATITAENPNQLVFVLNHAMIKDTVYGSDLGTFWYTSDLTSILSKYPQVVIFGGHLHFPLNDPRSIMQTDFTAVGSGSVNYMAIENGNYEDMASATTMNDRYDISSGNLVQIDKNGNMRIRRMDFANGKIIGEDWTVSHPTADKSHLEKYTTARGNSQNNTAPVMTTVEVMFGTSSSKRIPATVKFAAGADDEFVHHYEVSFGKKDGTKRTIKLLADFYREADPADMKKEWTWSIGTFEAGTAYEVAVTAYDSWGAVSNTVKVEVTAEGSGADAGDNVYVDFDVVNGELVDSKGNVSIVNKGGVCADANVTVNGKSVKVPAFYLGAKGKHAVCTFDKLSTASDMASFMEAGFTVEAFYVMPKKSGVQGIVCGTQSGGWGLAENAGKPYFIVGGQGGTGGYNPYSTVPSASSKTELVHVVGVYDYEARQLCTYVNGKLLVTQNVVGGYKNGDGKAFNMFCLGDDIKATGVAGDFPTPEMTLVDAKIYSAALSAEEVATAYDAAVSIAK